jgi:hypothetical protein
MISKSFVLRITLLLSLFLLVTSPALAQRSDFQAWSQLTTQIAIDDQKKWLFYFEAQPRVGDDVSRLERLLLRPAIGYNIDEDITLYLGYGWTPTYTNAEYEGDFLNENRIWQQILIKKSAFGLDWQHRLREEQRMIQDTSSVANRFRYLLRGSYKFCDCQDFGLTGYNELFVNINTVEGGPRAGFDRDRFFFGPFLQQGNARYEVGYLGEFGKRFGRDDRMVNALMLSVALNF